MIIEAPLSAYKKSNFKIGIATCIIIAVIFAYDGYLSKYDWSMRRSFYQEHFKNGKPDDTMIFNQVSPFILLAVGIGMAGRLLTIRNKKITADDKELIIDDKNRIPYESIEKIDKTHFDSKGCFIITYKDKNNNEVTCKISNGTYDNLAAILDGLVAKIS